MKKFIKDLKVTLARGVNSLSSIDSRVGRVEASSEIVPMNCRGNERGERRQLDVDWEMYISNMDVMHA